MAPFTPFLAEELYRKLTAGESVHLLDWPDVGHVNELIVDGMAAVREIITLGLAGRAENKLKVRQPLAKVTVINPPAAMKLKEHLAAYEAILLEELNVKQVEYQQSDSNALGNPESKAGLAVRIDTEITPELKREGLMREIVRNVQQARKQAGLEVDDRIRLGLETAEEEITTVLTDDNLHNTIKEETLAHRLQTTSVEGFRTEVKVEGMPLVITLVKTEG
jgi:isoleucyl-tRNA synthetase